MEWPYKDGGSIPSIFKEGGVLKAQKGKVIKALGKAAETIKNTGKSVEKVSSKLKRNTMLEHSMRMFEDNKSGTFSEYNVQNFLNAKNRGNYLDRTYDGRYALNVQDVFNRQNLTGDARIKFMMSHPVKSLEAPTQTSKNTFATGTWTTWENQLDDASRSFAKKYADQFPAN